MNKLFGFVCAAALIVSTPSSAQQEQKSQATPPAAPAAPMKEPKTYTFSGETLRGYQNVQSNLAEAAEKMPEEHYGFKPTPEVKSFGQHVAHIALSNYGLCSGLKNEPNPKKDEKEETTRSKADTVALLKGASAYCEPLVSGITEASLGELMPMGQDKVAKALIPLALIAHGDEVYGTMAVYLRLKGIVPPSTEKMKQEQAKRESAKKGSQ
jgi:uncharacterized damage-inducible protein DinB